MNSNDPGFQNRPEQYGCVCLRKTQKSKLKQNIKEAKTDSIVLQGLHLLAKEMVGLTPEGCVKCQSEVLLFAADFNKELYTGAFQHTH